MIVKLCGLSRNKVLEISDTMGYGYTLENVVESEDGLYDMQLPNTYVNIKDECLHIYRFNKDMYIGQDEFYKLEVL